MINSLPPSVIPTTNPAIAANPQPLAERGGDQSDPARITKPHEARAAHHGRHDHQGHGRSRKSEGSDLFDSAKHMIKNTFKDFRHDLRDSFRDLGLQGGMANKISKGVTHATRDALRSGVDFSAQLTVAALSQTTTTSATGTSSSFSLVAQSIEVNINHTTGTVDVSIVKVSIEGQFNEGLDGTQPHLLDMHDSDQSGAPDLTAAMLALQDLVGILHGGDDGGDDTVAAPAREAVDPVLESAPTDDDVPDTGEADDVAPVEEASDDAAEEATEESEETAVALPEIDTPLLLNNPDYSARIFITAFEHSINDQSERITFLRFDALIPLSSNSTSSTDDTAPEAPITETPVDDATDEEPVTAEA